MSYEEERATTVGFEDLLGEEDAPIDREARLRTGISRTKVVEHEQKGAVSPNAVRWLFNPFEFIDLRNEGASCGLDYLENVVFNPVKSISTNVGKTDAIDLPGSQHKADNYDKFARTAFMIADELCNKHGDKGVIELNLTGASDEDSAFYNQTLFGMEVDCAFDVNNEDFPVPVLPNVLEVMDYNLRQFSQSDAPVEQKLKLRDIARQLQASIALAMRYARARIDAAQTRLLDEKNPNRSLSPADQRCYLALGEEIPNVMPYLTRSAAQGYNNNSFDSNMVQTAVAAGVQAGLQFAAPKAPVVSVKAQTGVSSAGFYPATDNLAQMTNSAEFLPPPIDSQTLDFTVDETDIETADSIRYCAATTGSGEQCKKKAVDGSDFCAHPAHQN